MLDSFFSCTSTTIPILAFQLACTAPCLQAVMAFFCIPASLQLMPCIACKSMFVWTHSKVLRFYWGFAEDWCQCRMRGCCSTTMVMGYPDLPSTERFGCSTKATLSTFPCPSMICKPGSGHHASSCSIAQLQASLSTPSRRLQSRSHRFGQHCSEALHHACTVTCATLSQPAFACFFSMLCSSHAVNQVRTSIAVQHRR